MAKYAGVWGIDIGQAAFKALRCRVEDGKVVADAFDYIEYSKILSQPEADPESAVRGAIEQFLSRNDLKGYKIALAVSGQSGLAKFFKPPPVEAKRVPEIVKYEAKQQIPFALEDVVWDFQQMGTDEPEDFAVDMEVGLFAMKREQVYRAMKPFDDVGVELDIIQLAPLSVYNFVTYDILGEEAMSEFFDPDNPAPSMVVLSMGTETTDLVVTNGFRVWQRSIPLGGNHFTKQLTRELKLTFAKAEHLKRNVRQAEDPKMVFQAMKPVFSDLVTEVQRSIGYFRGIDRKATIDSVVVLGNAVKLPGLRQYLAKHLGFEVKDLQQFGQLSGNAVKSAPAFRDNQLSFGVCYGLCLQGLGVAPLRTNLVPREVTTERLVRAKKPWAVASVAALLLACTFSVAFHFTTMYEAAEERQVSGVDWKTATAAVESAKGLSGTYTTDDQQMIAKLGRITAIGEELVGNSDRKILWLEMLKAVNSTLPTTKGIQPGEIPDVKEFPLHTREEIHVNQLEVEYSAKLETWFAAVKAKYIDQSGKGKTPAADPNAAAAEAGPTGPTGEGWVIQLECYHLFNKIIERQGMRHVLDTVIKNLKQGHVTFPVAANRIRPGVRVWDQNVPHGAIPRRAVTSITPTLARNPDTGVDQITGYQMQLESLPGQAPPDPIQLAADGRVPVVFTMEEMGIGYPVVAYENPIKKDQPFPNPNYIPPDPGSMGGEGPGMAGPSNPMASGSGGASMGFGSPAMGSGTGAPAATKDDEPVELATIPVDIYQFTIQFCWKETLLTDRLEKQVTDWEAAKQTPATTPPAAEGDLAANLKGGA